MQTKRKPRILLTVLTVVFGLIATGAGFFLLFWADNQAGLYNNGLAHYRTLQFQEAARSFEQSVHAYDKAFERTWIGRFVYPKPNREVAALAALHQGNALMRMKDVPKAIKAFKLSIKLNPGNGFDQLPGFPQNMTLEDRARLMEQARIAKYNLELLLKNVPEPEQKEGNGNKIESKETDEEKDQIPQIAPGSQPGKGGADDKI